MLFDLSMQKKIVAAAMFKGLGDRRFPMYPLLNAANTIAQQEATGQLFTCLLYTSPSPRD